MLSLCALSNNAELSLHYLAKAKIMVVRDVERDDIEFISKVGEALEIDTEIRTLCFLASMK